MAKKSDREAMAAALGGMVSRPAPEPPAEPTPAPAPAQKAPEAAQTPRKARPKRKASSTRAANPKAPQATPEAEGGAFRKTGIGYVKADGTAMVRTVVMVTEDERQRLKMMALEAGLSPSDYVRRALGFLDT